jgi:hypothetical protein
MLQDLLGVNIFMSYSLQVMAGSPTDFDQDDLIDYSDVPPYQTQKEVRALTNDQLVGIASDTRFLLDCYANNNDPYDPTTHELESSFERLDAEVARRIQVGTLRIEDYCVGRSASHEPSPRKAPPSYFMYRNYFFYGCLASGGIGAVYAFAIAQASSWTFMFMSALMCFFNGFFLPVALISVIAIIAQGVDQLLRLIVHLLGVLGRYLVLLEQLYHRPK